MGVCVPGSVQLVPNFGVGVSGRAPGLSVEVVRKEPNSNFDPLRFTVAPTAETESLGTVNTLAAIPTMSSRNLELLNLEVMLVHPDP
jgi:hypothetical protein